MRTLLALDGSPSSTRARDLVSRLPWPAGTVIRLVSAYDVPMDFVPASGGGVPWVGDADDAIRDELSAELERLAGPLGREGMEIQEATVRGRPATVIIDQAHELGADLIVVGSRGRGPLAAILLGSVSAEVADQAPCPVLVTRSDRIARLLVATDGSDVARAIPQLLGKWGVFRGTPADALSVAPSQERTFELLADIQTPGAYRFADDRQDVIDRHRRFADEAAERLGAAGIPAASAVLAGDAAHEVIGAAQRFGSDLIVTGSRGLHGLQSVFLGSVARNVVMHAPCSVLVVRPAATRPNGTGGARATASVASG
jgi:nucleotide-binding universal stress UspA family protein